MTYHCTLSHLDELRQTHYIIRLTHAPTVKSSYITGISNCHTSRRPLRGSLVCRLYQSIAQAYQAIAVVLHERHGVSNRRYLDCLWNSLFGQTTAFPCDDVITNAFRDAIFDINYATNSKKQIHMKTYVETMSDVKCVCENVVWMKC